MSARLPYHTTDQTAALYAIKEKYELLLKLAHSFAIHEIPSNDGPSHLEVRFSIKLPKEAEEIVTHMILRRGPSDALDVLLATLVVGP